MNLKALCYNIATLNRLGERLGSGILTSLLAFPILLIGRLINHFSEKSFYFLALIFFLTFAVILEIASKSLEEKDPSIFVIAKTFALLIAFANIPLHLNNWKIILFGLIIFFILNLIKPLLLLTDLLKKIEELPGAAGIILINLIFGGIINILLQILFILKVK